MLFLCFPLLFQAVLDAVVSVMLVEGCTSTNALSRVLQLRHGALMSAVTPKPSATAKAQISQFVTLFLATLNIIHAIFGSKYRNRKCILLYLGCMLSPCDKAGL